MTENAETTENTEQTEARRESHHDPDRAPPEQDEGDPRVPVLRREAAGYRTKLREAEGERDALAEQVTAMRRGEVERIAGEQLADPGDLWRAEVQLDSLLGEDGSLDAEKVGAAIEQLVSEKPHYKKQSPPDFDGGARTSVERAPDFAETLREAAGGR